MTITFYCYPKCGTCRKAKAWLDSNEIEYKDVHIVDETPTEAQLREYIEASGLPIKRFFNTSGKKYRELGLKDELPKLSDEEKIRLLASDGMLVKRPITTDGKQVTLGFKEDEFEHTWK